jgi:hypothetical protein
LLDHRSSKFSPYGQKAVAKAKKNGQLVELACNYPAPKERKHLLASNTMAKNSDIWIKYVFREAYGLNSKNLGVEWKDFLAKVRSANQKDYKEGIAEELFPQYKKLISAKDPLNDEKIIEGIKILLKLFTKGHMDRQTLQVGISNLFLIQK